jgi:hypothetical protein
MQLINYTDRKDLYIKFDLINFFLLNQNNLILFVILIKIITLYCGIGIVLFI